LQFILSGNGCVTAYAKSMLATLSDQPKAIQLECRVIAVNSGGVSAPSNGAAVVL